MSSKFETDYKFIKNSWVDLPDFIKFYRTLTSGQQHSFLKYIEQMFHDEWWQTISNNSVRFIKIYHNLCKKHAIHTTLPILDKVNRKSKFAGVSRHRMVTQGIGDSFKNVINETTATVKNTAANIDRASHKAEVLFDKASETVKVAYFAQDRMDRTLGHVDALLQQFNMLVGTVVDKIQHLTTGTWVPTLTTIIAKFFAFGYLVSQKCNQNLTNIIALLLLIVPTNWSGLHSLANDLNRAIQGLINKFVTQEGDSHTNIILGFFELIKNILQSVFGTLNDEQFKKMTLSSQRLRAISDTIRSTTTIFDFITKLVMKLIETVGDKCLQYFGWLPWFARDRSIEPLINEYEQIKLLNLESLSQVNKYAALRIISLHDALLSAEAKLQKRFLKGSDEMRSIAPYLRLMIKNLSDIIAKVPEHFRTGRNPRRVKPFWVYIYGDPRIGKSAVLQPYIVNALAKSLQLIPAYEDYTNYTYFRNCGEEYWEGYYGQSVLWYNDLLQNHADEQAMNLAVLELTNVVDDNLFPLNMAFERKHGVYFDSELVISNAQDDLVNAGFIRQKCWSGGSHLLARRNVVLKMTLNSKYAASNGVGYDNNLVQAEMRNNPNNVFGKTAQLFPRDMYIIEVHDNLDGSLKHQLSFEQAIKYLQDQAADFKSKQNLFKDKLYAEFEALWAQSGDSDLPPHFYERLDRLLNSTIIRIHMNIDTYLQELSEGRPLARIGKIIVDINKLDLKIDCINADTDISVLAYQRCGDLNIMANAITQAYVGNIADFEVNNDNYQQPTTQSVPPVVEEVVFYDADDTYVNLVTETTESISEQIRLLFPDLMKHGWEEGVLQYNQDKIVLPDISKPDNPGASVLGDVMSYTRYFQGVDLSNEKKMRIVFTIEAVGYKLFDNMSAYSTRTFCQMARDTLKRYCNRAYAFIINNPVLNAIIHVVTVGTIIMSVNYGLALGASAVYKKFINERYDQWTDEQLHATQVAIRQEVTRRSGFLAETSEGSNKIEKKQIKRVIKKSMKTQAYDTQNQVVENIVKNQMCKFSSHVVHNGEIVDARMYGAGLCVGGDIFLLPDHFTTRWVQLRNIYEPRGDKVVITLYWNANQQVVLDWESLEFFKLPYEHSDDLCFMRIKNLVQMRRLNKFFHSASDNPSLFDSYLFGQRAGDFTCGVTSTHRTEMVSQIYEHPERLDVIYGQLLPGREIFIPLCYKYYDARTTNGDCGILLMCTDSRLNCRKILGMHVAGGGDAAVSSIVYCEDIDEAFEHFAKNSMVADIQDDLKPVEDKLMAQSLEEIGLVVAGELSDVQQMGYPVKRNPKICLPRKNKVQRSLIHDIMNQDYGPTTLAPAKMRPFKGEDGVVISPLMNGLKKLTKCSPMVPKNVCVKIVDHMYKTIKSWHSPYDDPRLLTDDEVVNGFGILKPIEFKTSPGYPYVLLDNTNGKIPFFVQNGDKWEMGPLVQAKYREREELAKQGIVPPTYFIATLKDETRPIEKVKLGKTRIFQISPMDYNMLLRKYFGYFIAHCHSTFLNGEMAVGINANSYEWTQMIKFMMEVGDRFINGDGENFDASTGQQYSMENLEVINRWYGDSEVNQKVRRILYITFLNAKNIVGRVVVTLKQGNQSGTYLTTIFNNMTGMFAIRYTYIRAGYDLSTFHLYVRNKDYGDDDLICVSHLVPEVNFFSHQQTLAMMGIRYTTAQKNEISASYYTLHEITFLKRKFVLVGNRYQAQLPMEVILEIPRWSESDPTKMDDQLNRFNSALLEASNYDEIVFMDIQTHFTEYIFLLQRAGFQILPQDLFSYERCFAIKYPEICGVPIQQLSDRALVLPITNVVLNAGGSGSVTLGKFDELDSCRLISYRTANDYETQSAEGSTKPPVKNIVRIIKTQGEEELGLNDRVIMDDFQCEMFLLEKVREMAPHMQVLYNYTVSQLNRHNIRTAARRLCHSIVLLNHVFNNCISAFSGVEPMVTQGEENMRVEQGQTITSQRHIVAASVPGIEEIPIGSAQDGEDVVKEKTTVFINDEVPHQPVHPSRQIRRDWVSVRDVDLAQFYERPYILEEFQWSSGNDGKMLKSYNFPSSLYNITALKNKLANICFARPDIEIEVLINGTTFHYGTLTIAVIPFPDFTSHAYRQVGSVTTWPQWYDLTAGAGQSVKFIVPYKHLYHTQHVTTNFSQTAWSSIHFYITAPLQSVSVTTPPAVGVTVIARLLKPQFCGMVTQGEQDMLSQQKITTQQTPLGTVSTPLFGVARVAESASKLAASCGWSIPVNTAATTPMQLRYPLFCKSEDLPASTVLGPSQSARVDKDFSNVNADMDEMEFSNLINHPSLVDRVTWKSSASSGNNLWSKDINSEFFQNFSAAATNVTYPTPLGYLVNGHRYWRGSVKICIRVVASSFHAGRLRFCYAPTWQGTWPVTTISSANLKNVTIDINGTTDTVIEVPYDTEKPWMTGVDYMGTISLIVINPLTSGTTLTPTDVYIKIFAWGGPDFQVNYPIKATYRPDLRYKTAPTMVTQGEERMVKACQLPASSADCLKMEGAIWLGDVDRRQLLGNSAASYIYRSIKQTISMLTPLGRFKTADTNKVSEYKINPLYCTLIGTYDAEYWNNYMTYYRCIYYHVRGGYRLVAITDEPTQMTTLMLESDLTSQPVTEINAASYNYSWLWPIDAAGTQGGLENIVSGLAFFGDSSLGPVDVTVPYWSTTVAMMPGIGYMPAEPTKAARCWPDGLEGDHVDQAVTNQVIAVLSNQETVKHVVFFAAGADDLMFGYRRSIPRCINTATEEITTQGSGVVKKNAPGQYIDVRTKRGLKIFDMNTEKFVVPEVGMNIMYHADITKDPKEWGGVPTLMQDSILAQIQVDRLRRSAYLDNQILQASEQDQKEYRQKRELFIEPTEEDDEILDEIEDIYLKEVAIDLPH